MKGFKYKINGNPYTVNVGDIEGSEVVVEVNGTSYTVELEVAAPPKIKPVVRPAAAPAPAAAPVTPVARPAAAGAAGGIKSPLPGVILEVKCKEGDAVKRGQTLLILEAMKMENDIKADHDGVVKQILVSKGESILEGTDLIIVG